MSTVIEAAAATHEAESNPSTKAAEQSWAIEAFYDGDCPLCVRDIDFICWLDRKGRLRLINIADPSFDAARYGKTMDELMGQFHGRLPDGTWTVGVETFRQIYAAIGFSWLVAPTRLPGISHALDYGYRLFAENRLKWTGRCKKGRCK